jgi:DNA-binding response OmpR family regulator
MIRSEDGRTQPARVLIIDDDELTTATFAQMLRLEGHEVRTAQNAKTALDEASDLPPDAIIVDLHMPVMDGLTFIQRLRSQKNTTQTPVAMVTGDYSMSPCMSAALKDLGVTLCFKPLWLEDLVKLAGELLASRA